MIILLFLAGLVLILLGAKYLVDGSMAVAKRCHMPEFLIGVTIMGIGTSMPEMVVSVMGAAHDYGSVAIGNVIGSNLANTLLILGITALIRPIPMERNAIRFDIPYCIFITALLLPFCFGLKFWDSPGGVVTHWEGVILLALFAFFMVRSFRSSKEICTFEEQMNNDDGSGKPTHRVKMWLAATMIAGGIAGLVFGGHMFVKGAVGIARAAGMSESVIAITIMAFGTSIPELASSVVAAAKGRTQLALGNILGSNVANICLILGTSAVVAPLGTGSINISDIYITLLASVLLLVSVFTFRKKMLDRPEGAIFLFIYIAYIYMITARPGLLESVF